MSQTHRWHPQTSGPEFWMTTLEYEESSKEFPFFMKFNNLVSCSDLSFHRPIRECLQLGLFHWVPDWDCRCRQQSFINEVIETLLALLCKMENAVLCIMCNKGWRYQALQRRWKYKWVAFAMHLDWGTTLYCILPCPDRNPSRKLIALTSLKWHGSLREDVQILPYYTREVRCGGKKPIQGRVILTQPYYFTIMFQHLDLLFKCLVGEQTREWYFWFSHDKISWSESFPCYRVILFKCIHLSEIYKHQARIIQIMREKILDDVFQISKVYILLLVLWDQREHSEKSEIIDWFRLIF